jgi:hypothetical protein
LYDYLIISFRAVSFQSEACLQKDALNSNSMYVKIFNEGIKLLILIICSILNKDNKSFTWDYLLSIPPWAMNVS